MAQPTDQEAREKLWRRIITGDYLTNDVIMPMIVYRADYPDEENQPITERITIKTFEEAYGKEGVKRSMIEKDFGMPLETLLTNYPSLQELVDYANEIAKWFQLRFDECTLRGDANKMERIYRELMAEDYSREKFEELKGRFNKEPQVPLEGIRK